MKSNTSRKLIFTTLLIAFVTLLSGLLVNLLTNDNEFKVFIDKYLATKGLLIGVSISAAILLVFTYFQIQYAKQSEQTTEKENSANDSEQYVKEYYASLIERYRKRYKSKLDGRFEITLEVSENWDGADTKEFKGEYEGKGQISEAFAYISSAFEKQRRLLIVGNPGAGKTVLLLKLALELLEKAGSRKEDETYELIKGKAFPVIFNLASWSDEHKKFDDWLISVLNSGEGLSKEVAGKLLQDERITFLLDGLDELARDLEKDGSEEGKKEAAKIRAKCLESLNDYLDRGKKAVICCRVDEFERMHELTGKDAPVSAKAKVNDLSEAEVLNTLMKIEADEMDEKAAENLLGILNKDKNSELPKVLSTPFYFTTALEVFDKHNFEEVDLPKDEQDWKNYLRRKFIGKKLNITPNPNEFDAEKTKKWLTFLAELINRKKLITFELADLQPSDLNGKRKFSLLFGLLIGLVGCFVVGSVFGFIGGFILNFISAFFVSIIIYSKKIHTEDLISLDFSKIFDRKFWAYILFLNLIIGLSCGIAGGLYIGFTAGLIFGLSSSLISALYSCFVEFKIIKGFSNLENSYQRIKGGFLTNLYFSFLLTFLFITGKIFTEFYIQDGNIDLYKGLNLALVVILYYAVMKLLETPLSLHLILRLCLYIEDKMPLKYVTFLNYAAEARILEKDGGHWRFRHQNLQDYFADLDAQEESPVLSRKLG